MKIYDYDGCKNISRKKIKEERLKRGMTQEDLAVQLQLRGVVLGRDSISRLERGNRFVPDYELMVLADIFNVSADYLLS